MREETGGLEGIKAVDHAAEIEALRAERDALKAQLAATHLVLLYQLVIFRVGKDPAAEPGG